MKAIRIRDLVPGKGYLAVDLLNTLALLENHLGPLEWVASDVWATGERSQELEALAEKGARIKSEQLLVLAKAVNQVIDGEFKGYLADAEKPWVIVRAVDSSWYELHCEDVAVIEQAKQRFKETKAIESA